MSILPISVLMNQAPLDHELFSAHRELEARLKATVRGDVLFDLGSRTLYAADASNYRQMPVGVIAPRDAADVAARVEVTAAGRVVVPLDAANDGFPDAGALADRSDGETRIAACLRQGPADAHRAPPRSFRSERPPDAVRIRS